MSSPALLLLAASEREADVYYATKFLAPDPFICLQLNGRNILLMSDLELDRAKAQARVDEVRSYSQLAAARKQTLRHEPSMYEVIQGVLADHGVTELVVPAATGIQHVEGLRKLGLTVTFRPDPFFPERLLKSEEEIAHITATQRATEAAVEVAIDLIRRSTIEQDTLVLGGQVLTAEQIKKVIHLHLLERGCIAQHTIVACGQQACDPHHEGTGPLRPHQPIVLDVFPQHMRTRYFADMTRTVVKGKASPKLKRMYELVGEGQEMGFRMIKAGVNGQAVHQAILDHFTQAGFPTGEQGGRMQGFFHGTGHGVGLEIHEPPRISPRSDTLQAGMVVTVEPGLYYLDAGGVRLEDMVVVTPTGCRNLTQAPKILEV